jgi:two-component system, OmpR family, response regulator
MKNRNEAQKQILVVDDDPGLRALVSDYLSEHGFLVKAAENAIVARDILDRNAIDVVILDVMMPGEDGLSLARSLANRNDLAIIMASALGSETDRIVGLEVGADDYLPKPISPRELVARVRAVLRRRDLAESPNARGATFLFDGWRCDIIRGVVYDPEQVVISLSHGEYALLRSFLEHPQRILSRDQLLDFYQSGAGETFDRAIDTQVSRLRRKLASRTDVELIRTIRAEGYMFVPKVTRI